MKQNDSRCDVLVAGGGPAGFLAAASAARAGADTLLIERHGFLGGMLSAGEVRNIRRVDDGNGHYIVGDLTLEYLELLRQRKGAFRDPLTQDFVQQDPEITKVVTETLCQTYGVRLLYHTMAVSAIMDGSRITGVQIANKDGLSEIHANVVIDATGDGDIAAFAGANCSKDDALQPMTLTFLVGGVHCDNQNVLAVSQQSRQKLRDMQDKGLYPVPRNDLAAFTTARPGEVYCNVTRAVGDGTSASDLTRCEIECRAQAHACVAFLKEHIEEFRDCYLMHTAAQVGLRESRIIKGGYALTGEDVLTGRSFPDTVALGSYKIDIHHTGKTTTHIDAAKGIVHQIPYRCLLPDVGGLLVAGRCASSTKEGNGAIRVMGTCMNMGQAAGAAAAMAAGQGILPAQVNVDALRRQLIESGMPLDRIDETGRIH